MADTWTMITERQKSLQKFYNQVDKTRRRLKFEQFKLKDPLTNKNLDDVINVTENRSATYMTRIIAGLMSSKWQTVIEGEITSREANKIEKFIDSNLEQADEYMLNWYGLAGLDAWLCNHVCHTSLIGVQWMSYIKDEDKEYKVHCLPLDMRWTPFVQNKWAANITFRDKDDLEQELESYQKEAMDKKRGEYKKPSLADGENEVRDYWDKEKGELWIASQLVFKQPNIYKSLPFVIVWVPSGFMFRDRNYLEHESPSLLFLNENLFDQISRQLSVDATLGYNSIAPPYEREVKNPTGDISMPAPRRGESQDVLEGEVHKPVPTGDINRAEMATRDEINRMVDDAAPMAPRSYTTPPSAIEVATEVELFDELQNPRVIALQMFKEQLARLIVDQCMLLGERNILAGKRGKRQVFGVGDFKDPDKYSISYQLMKQNKRLAIVNEARALALWGKAPMKYILRDVLSVEDPDGWDREMELEKAKAANPAIGLAEMAVRYAEEAEDLEGVEKDLKSWQSMVLVHDYVMIMRQRMQPAMPGETENLREATKETSNAGGLISLLGQRAGNLPQPAQKGVTSGRQME